MKILHRHGLCALGCFFSAVCLMPLSTFAVTPITSSGLNTQVSDPIAVGGQTHFNITGGTRPGGGTNLFHSFGNFNVPNANIANFLNESGLPTSNILGRVTGGNVSNIFGTLQTTGFGNANLFLMNPAGFLFGPNATVNVGGMVSFTTADYLRLADGARFNAIPSASADALLSAAPVAAFGFLGSNPGAITVQGSQLTVAEDTGISLVGGNIAVQSSSLNAPSGQINLISVGRPSKPNVGGRVIVAGSGQGSGFTPSGFATLGTVSLSETSAILVSARASDTAAGKVVIRGGRLVMNETSISASSGFGPSGSITLDSSRGIDIQNSTLSVHHFLPRFSNFPNGTIDLKAGSSINISNSNITAGAIENAGSISMAARIISLSGSTLAANSDGNNDGNAVTITLAATRSISLTNGTLLDASTSIGGGAGTILINGGNLFSASQSSILATSAGIHTGQIHVQAKKIALTDNQLSTFGIIFGGNITLEAKNTTLTNSRILSTSTSSITGHGGTIDITTKALHQDPSSVIDASSEFGTNGTVTLNGVVQP
jgi:filamentous hemagglutinin family protein